jgi:hypothetical protein
MNSYVNQLVDAQHEAIDAMQPEMIRAHRTVGVIDCGPCEVFKVWHVAGSSSATEKAEKYSEALRLMERALADGAGVVTIEWTHGREWRQEVWALEEVQ